jgi:hypothetical protein
MACAAREVHFEEASHSHTSGMWHLPNDFDNSRKKSQDNQLFLGVLATLSKIRIL